MTRTWFAEQYGREPDGIWFAPGRVNLMGGPDYTEGFVLPFALGAGVTAAAAWRSDRRVRQRFGRATRTQLRERRHLAVPPFFVSGVAACRIANSPSWRHLMAA